jgi:CCR4-NOT transcription complex subunit 1
MPNFTSIICAVYEGGNRQKIFQHDSRIPDEISPSNIAKTLKLSPSQTVAFAFALMQSQYRSVVIDAKNLMKSKLPEITSFNDIQEHVVHAIAHAVSTSEDLCSSDVARRILQVVATPTVYHGTKQQSDSSPMSAASNPLRNKPTLFKAINEFGYACTTTCESFLSALQEIKIPLDEYQLGDFIISIIPHNRDKTSLGETIANENLQLYTLTHDTAESSGSSDISKNMPVKYWNLDVIASVLSDKCVDMNWSAVVKCMDLSENIFIPNEKEIIFLINYVKRISNKQFPVTSLLGSWSNCNFQLSMLSYSITATRDMIDYTDLVKTQPQLLITESMLMEYKQSLSVAQQQLLNMNIPKNNSLFCLQLYSTLLLLSTATQNSKTIYNDVLKLFTDLCNVYPECILLGLSSQSNESNTSQTTSIRSEILRRLLPLFTNLNNSLITSRLVMMKLYDINKDIFVILNRLSLKRCTKLSEIYDIYKRLIKMGTFGTKIQDECNIDEILSLWCLLSDMNELNLNEKLMYVINLDIQFSKFMYNFLCLHVDNIRSRNVLQYFVNALSSNTPSSGSNAYGNSGILSFENFAIIMNCLQNCTTVVPVQDLRNLNNIAVQRQQQQKQLQAQQLSVGNTVESNANMDSNTNASNSATSNEGVSQSSTNPVNALSSIHQLPPPTAPTNSSSTGTNNGDGPAEDIIEDVANSYFQKIYTADMSITEVIQLLKRFKSSVDPREQEIFRCMIHNLFDEYRFFHKYPEKELQVTGKLFGTLIQHQLVSSITLGIALRYILEALRKDPEIGGSNEKMFRFGKIALEQFRSRLGEWPQYCSHLVQITHLPKHCLELYNEAQKAMNNPTTSPRAAAAAPSPPKASQQVADHGHIEPNAVQEQKTNESVAQYASTNVSSLQTSSTNAPQQPVPEEPYSNRKIIQKMVLINTDGDNNNSLPSDQIRDQIHFIVNNIAKSNVDMKTCELRNILNAKHFTWFANYLIVKRVSTQPNLHSLYLSMLDLFDNALLVKAVLQSTYYNVTRLLQSNKITTSSSERSLLRNLGVWLGQITLAKNKPILQRRCDIKELLLWGYESGRLIAVCSFIAKIVESCKDSKVFRPPNPWLMNILSILKELYEIDDLKMNIKFEVQVLYKNIGIKIEDVPASDIVATCCTPPIKDKNPDFNVKNSAAISNVPGTLQGQQLSSGSASTIPLTSPVVTMLHSESPNIHSNLIASSGSTSTLNQMSLLPPSVRNPSNQQSNITNTVDGMDHTNTGANVDTSNSSGTSAINLSALPLEQTVIPNLAAHVVINPSIPLFANNSNLRRIVPLAVDRAIREIIQPVIERCVNISCITTQQIILKDFASEPNENNMRRAAHLMVSSLAGSLTIVTCREPLRISISSHLLNLLSSCNIDMSIIEPIIQICASDNVELGCKLIEKAATEKAIRDLDEVLAPAFQVRRKHRESGTPYVDTSQINTPGYPKDLCESLKVGATGLQASQLPVYEAFQRQKSSFLNQPQQGAAESSESKSAISQSPQLQGQVAALTMAQSFEAYQHALAKIDKALKLVLMQSQGRDVTLSMLGGDHEILLLLREIILITQSTAPNTRIESAMTFAESVFKRLVETSTVNDTLRLEVIIGIVEALRDACGGPRKFLPDIISWLNQYSSFNIADEGIRKLHRDILTLLMRAKLLRPQEVDSYFANNLDGGRNMVWVEAALSFIRHCLSENLAASFEFQNIFDIVSKMRPSNMNVRKQLQKWLTDIKTISASKEDQKTNAATATPTSSHSSPPVAGNSPNMSSAASTAMTSMSLPPQVTSTISGNANVSTTAHSVSRDQFREHVVLLLDRWLRIWTQSTEQIFAQYLQAMHHYGVLKTEESADKFFRVATEVCVEACLKSGQTQPNAAENGVNSLQYNVVDALSKLFLLLIRLADKESDNINVRINLLNRILNGITKTLIEDHETKKLSTNPSSVFDQRPYFRIYSNLLQDFGVVDPKMDLNSSLLMLPLLHIYYQVFVSLQPSLVPGFAFSWLQLISSRFFMPHLLHGKSQKGWPYMNRLLLLLLNFMNPFLRTAQLNEPIRKLYKGTLKILLVLLHDFPEFLCDYHLTYCDIIPITCVQLRNLILSAFPKTMRLPDPFTPNLKVDLLPDITQSPRILTDFIGILNERGIKQRLDTYLSTKQPADLPLQLINMFTSIAVTTNNSVTSNTLVVNNVLLTSIVIYIASYTIALQSQQQQKTPLHLTIAMDMFKQFINLLDSEGRYFLLNTMVNQLRYPNNHTHYFSCVILNIFVESDNEFLQEQITRVLLERLIVHRPHPVIHILYICNYISNIYSCSGVCW